MNRSYLLYEFQSTITLDLYLAGHSFIAFKSFPLMIVLLYTSETNCPSIDLVSTSKKGIFLITLNVKSKLRLITFFLLIVEDHLHLLQQQIYHTHIDNIC